MPSWCFLCVLMCTSSVLNADEQFMYPGVGWFVTTALPETPVLQYTFDDMNAQDVYDITALKGS